jgi:ATP-dependent RNA helicase HelY
MNQKVTEIAPPELINSLRSYNLLPAILFLPTRRRCDEAATEVALGTKKGVMDEKREKRQTLYDEYVKENPEISKHKHKNLLIRGGVASHHAGHIPAWKLLVEKMMAKGLLDAIFATSTVAAGVDFPARTVCLTFADTRGNDGWRPLQTSELQQMTGRAGRRGKDNVGFVVLAPSNFQNPQRIATLLKSPPDALTSQFRATYTSLLNLLDAFKSFSQVRDIAEKSFAFRDTARQISKLEARCEERKIQLAEKLPADLTIDNARAFERLTSAKNRLNEKLPMLRAEIRANWLKENVQPGRIVSQGRSGKRFFLVLDVYGEKVSAMKEDGGGTSFALNRVTRVYAKKYPLNAEAADKAFYEIVEDKNLPLEEPKHIFKSGDNEDTIAILDSMLMLVSPNDETTAKLWETWNDAEFLERTERDIEFLRSGVWLPFERRAKILHEFGYLDFPAQKVTEAGKWLADVRVDRPLLVGEALRHGLFQNAEPTNIAGLMAGLASDADRNYGELYLSDKILQILDKFEQIAFDIATVEWKNGVEPAPEMNYSAIATAEAWARGMSWDELVSRTKAEEGDLVRLLSRTGEALLQIAALKKTQPEAAELASQTADIILREPIR